MSYYIDLPFKQEGDVCLDIIGCNQLNSWACGFAAGWTVAKTFHTQKNEKAENIFYTLCQTNRDGTETANLKKALKSFGVGVRHYRGGASFALVRRSIDAGFPVICCIKGGECNHWCVAVGYNGVTKTVLSCGNHFFSDLKRCPMEKWEQLTRGEDALVCWGEKKPRNLDLRGIKVLDLACPFCGEALDVLDGEDSQCPYCCVDFRYGVKDDTCYWIADRARDCEPVPVKCPTCSKHRYPVQASGEYICGACGDSFDFVREKSGKICW